MNALPIKPLVLDLVHRAREEELAFAAGLSAAERAARGSPGSWSATYTLAHLTAAKRRLTQALRAVRRGEAPSLEHDEVRVYADNEGRAWDEVETEAQRVFVAFVAEVEGFHEAELADEQHATVLDGRTLVAHILGHGVWHPYSHLADYYQRRDDGERATRLQWRLNDAMGTMERIPMVHGDPVTLYNMACVQARAGRPERGVELLEEALRLDPALGHNARTDPDLAALRGNPTFQALATA